MKKSCLLMLSIILLFQLSINSQVSTQQQKKLALVIGNGNYVSSSILANPENDARSMKAALQSVGFTVMEYENLTQSQMKKAIDDFGERLKSNDVGLFFYAGHGIQAKGYNYLIPIDAKLQSEQQVEYDCVQADRVLALMEASGSKVNILILDACRNNPFERSWTRSATGRGLAFMNAPSGTLIAYATSPGTTASDGSGNNGLYTAAILESMKIPNITIIQMFQNVRGIVSQKSGKQQIPWESTSLIGDVYLSSEGSSLPNNREQDRPEFNTKDISDNRKLAGNSTGKEDRNSILISYEWSVLSLKLFVKSYIEKTYTVANKFGSWNPVTQVQLTKVIFHENGMVKEISDYDFRNIDRSNMSFDNIDKVKIISKTIYQPEKNDSIKVGNYNSSGIIKKEYQICLLNDSTITKDKETFILKDSKLAKMMMSEEANKIKYWNYTINGLISNIKEIDKRKTEVLKSYDYLEYDEYGNWTKRLEYSSSTNPDYIIIREYKY